MRIADGGSGGAIFFVSNDRSGTMSLTGSLLERNPGAGFETAGLPGIFVLAAPGQPQLFGTMLNRWAALSGCRGSCR